MDNQGLGTWTTRGVGEYRTSEIHVGIFGRDYRPDQTRRGIIYCHGYGVDGDAAVNPLYSNHPYCFARAGYPVLSTDLGGAATWGTAGLSTGYSAAGAIDDAWTYLKTAFGANTDSVILFAGSMGGANAVNWAANNLSSTAAVALLIPVIDLEDIRANDRGGYQSSVDTVWGVTYPTALPDGANPTDAAALFDGVVPIRIWYSTSDPIIDPPTVTTFAGTAGATAVSMGDIGHFSTALPSDVIAFLDPYR